MESLITYKDGKRDPWKLSFGSFVDFVQWLKNQYSYGWEVKIKPFGNIIELEIDRG